MNYEIGTFNGPGGNSRKAVIKINGKPITLLDARGSDVNIENLKKHIERVMRNYKNAIELVGSGNVSTYTPAKIKHFEYVINGASMALLTYKGYTFAQVDLGAFRGNLDVSIKFIYNTAQSYIRYLKSFVDGKDGETGKKKKR